MVRVISVHHFDSQSIQTCEDPIAVTTAPPDRLLVALTHHVIEVRDLSNRGEATFSFPTVDQVCHLLYCSTGNYIATLETKMNRQGQETIYTRVYANWERVSDKQSMRARIAGRVTPSSSQTGDDMLEMIELPVKFPTTTAIACCQATGNLLVSCLNSICLFQLVTRTHDISRQRFLDFELWPVTLELSFNPLYLAMVEDVVAAMNGQSLHVFRINKGVTRASDWSGKSSSSSSPSITKCYGGDGRNKPLKKEKKTEVKKIEWPIDVDALSKDLTSPYRVLFPTIAAAKNEHLNLPFKSVHSSAMGVAVKEMPMNEPWAEQMTTMVESLLQLEVIQDEQLHCLVLRPLYINATSTANVLSECPRLRSASYFRLLAFNCVIATHQEAYLYHFAVENGDVGLGYCISVYSFTSPVSHICLESYMLHALTNTGLETYTMRSTHAVYNKLGPVTKEDPICLVGLRPFIGAVDLLISESQLVVLSSSDEQTSWTVYSLQLPTPNTLYEDMVAVATSHQYSISGTYKHLLCEAHAVLYTAQFLSTSPTAVGSPMSQSYVSSCQRLADLYLTSNLESDWKLGVLLYEEIDDKLASVFIRLQVLQAEAKQRNVQLDFGPGLAHYIQGCLASRQELWLPPEALEFLSPILLAGLLLQSQKIRETTKESHINILCDYLQNNKNPVVCVAATVLFVDRGKTNEATELLKSVEENSSDIKDCLLQHWTLLLDNLRQVDAVNDKSQVFTFSELGVFLMMAKPRLLAAILAAIVTDKQEMDLQQILQVFLAYLPSRMGVAGTAASIVLQGFLEHVLVHDGQPNLSAPSTREALQILMRSYLSDLRINPKGVPGEQNPFPGNRPIFLHLLPPFAVPEHISLIKLEWLIYNGWLDVDCLNELTQYVNEVLPTCLSLKVLAQPNGVKLLIDQCPVAVLQYVKEMLKNEAQLQECIIYLEEVASHEDTDIYGSLLNDVLNYLSERLTPEALWRVLPGGNEKKFKYKTHLATCQQLAHADHIRSMIIATSKQLLTTLNL